VRQQHLGHSAGVVGFVVAQPAQLGRGERGDHDAADRVRARLRAAELLDQVLGLGRGPGVVPQQRVAHRLPGLVQGDHAVLLPSDRDRVGALDQPVGGHRQRVQPGARIHLGARRVRSRALADHGAVVGVEEQRLGGLRRGVDAEDEGHAPI
jgi:hypothetical protein